jgi:hypothetical protein
LLHHRTGEANRDACCGRSAFSIRFICFICHQAACLGVFGENGSDEIAQGKSDIY